jgi:hypothetical protein
MPQATMTELKTSDGKVITDENRILKEVHKYYTNLYSADTCFKENQEHAMKFITAHLHKILSDKEIQAIEKLPDKEEIHKTLKALASNKAPKIDGIT